ncbi:hypothetical protein, partial [Nocardia abscessus]|uniref:hypothetical protein n=1 Tax=Nocardia abscessus TaxID=120957 RepID=UPI003CC7CC79
MAGPGWGGGGAAGGRTRRGGGGVAGSQQEDAVATAVQEFASVGGPQARSLGAMLHQSTEQATQLRPRS